MLSYELCQKLKEAGFPIVVRNKYGMKANEINLTFIGPDGLGDFYKTPTLSELISACGDKFSCLWKTPKGWIAKWFMNMEKAIEFGSGENVRILKGEGNSPEEAVAHLFLALHEKTDK